MTHQNVIFLTSSLTQRSQQLTIILRPIEGAPVVKDGRKITQNVLGEHKVKSDNNRTTIPRCNFKLFYAFKMAVAIAFFCVNAVEAI